MNKPHHTASEYQQQLTFTLPNEIVEQWDKDDAMAVIWQILDKLKVAQSNFRIDAIYYGYLRKADEQLVYGKCYEVCNQDEAIPVRLYRQAFTPELTGTIQPGTLFYWFEGFIQTGNEEEKKEHHYFEVYQPQWDEDAINQVEAKTLGFLGELLRHPHDDKPDN